MSRLQVSVDGQTHQVHLELAPGPDGRLRVLVDGAVVEVELPSDSAGEAADELDWIIVDGRPYDVIFDRDLRWVRSYQGLHRLEVRDLEAINPRPRTGNGRIKAPIPGLITRLFVSVGEEVADGQALLILEAMKMENEIHAAHGGVVRAVHVREGQGVKQDEVLVEIE
jgi:biotin carboxyl carrier protein